MKKMRTLLYDVFVVIGITVLVSKLVSRTFGLKEVLMADTRLLIGYELAIVLLVSLGVYWYKRRRKAGGTKSPARGGKVLQERAISDLRSKLGKAAIVLRSTPASGPIEGRVSCLGRVTWQQSGEECPVDAEGKPLDPLATLFVPDLPGVPEALRKVALITIFAPEDAWAEDPDEEPQLGCVIRTYATLEGLVPCNYVSESLKTCILTPEAVANDMPKWPGCGGSDEMWDSIQQLEEKHKLEYHEDICDAVYENVRKVDFPADFSSPAGRYAVYETHKIGGYPTYAQGCAEMPEDYPFVMQLNYDSDAELEIGDCGSYYFYYNAEKNAWLVYSDCY